MTSKTSTALLAVLLGLAGCATAQRGAMNRARAYVLRGDYQAALTRLDDAQRYAKPSADLQAEIEFLRAESLAGLGDKAGAEGLYRHVCATFPETAWSYRSSEAIKVLHGLEVQPGVINLAPTWDELTRWLTTRPPDADAALSYATRLSQAEDLFAEDITLSPAALRDLYLRALPAAPFKANQSLLQDRLDHFEILAREWTPEQAEREIEHSNRVVASLAIKETRLALLGLYAQRKVRATPSDPRWSDITHKIQINIDGGKSTEIDKNPITNE